MLSLSGLAAGGRGHSEYLAGGRTNRRVSGEATIHQGLFFRVHNSFISHQEPRLSQQGNVPISTEQFFLDVNVGELKKNNKQVAF